MRWWGKYFHWWRVDYFSMIKHQSLPLVWAFIHACKFFRRGESDQQTAGTKFKRVQSFLRIGVCCYGFGINTPDTPVPDVIQNKRIYTVDTTHAPVFGSGKTHPYFRDPVFLTMKFQCAVAHHLPIDFAHRNNGNKVTCQGHLHKPFRIIDIFHDISVAIGTVSALGNLNGLFGL